MRMLTERQHHHLDRMSTATYWKDAKVIGWFSFPEINGLVGPIIARPDKVYVLAQNGKMILCPADWPYNFTGPLTQSMLALNGLKPSSPRAKSLQIQAGLRLADRWAEVPLVSCAALVEYVYGEQTTA